MQTKTIAIGSDHAGFALRQIVAAHLRERGFTVVDVGTNSTDSCHYPVYAHKVCTLVTEGKCDLGILVCGTGIGMSMAANKHRGIRAACCSDTYSARLTRQHNDANVLCFGERVVGQGLALDLADVFVDTPFEGGKHGLRIAMFEQIEDGSFEG